MPHAHEFIKGINDCIYLNETHCICKISVVLLIPSEINDQFITLSVIFPGSLVRKLHIVSGVFRAF